MRGRGPTETTVGRHRGPHAGVLDRARDRPRAAGDEGARDRLPGRGRQRLRDLERLRQPLLAGALLRRRGRHHPRPALRRRTLRAVGARHPAAARRRARARLRRRGRRGGRGRLGSPADARDVSRLRAQRALRVTGRRRVRRTAAATSSPSACASTTGPSPASGRSDGRMSCSTGPVAASPAGSTHATRISCWLPETREPIPFRVLLDGEAPGRSHGVDVDEDGNGMLRNGRLHQLVREHDAVRERTLDITFLEPGRRGVRVHLRIARDGDKPDRPTHPIPGL